MGRAPRKRRSRRRPAGGGAGGPDYLSGLPDDVLLAIFSRLSTRYAVTLSVLSRRFRILVRAKFGRVDSASVVDPTLPLPSLAARPSLLRRLSFKPPRGVSAAAFHRLLDAAADRGVSELTVRLRRSGFLPKNILSIRTLTVISLDTCALPRWCPAACPHLRTLKLIRVAIPQRMINVVLEAAPVLQTLEMVYCVGFAGSCIMESSAVRNLLFKPALEQRGVRMKMVGLRTVALYTRPKVQVVRLDPAPEIRKAYLHIARPRNRLQLRIRPFLDAGTGLTCLTLRGIAIKLLSSEYKETPKLAVTFEDLRILSVSLDFSNESELIFLLKLLESSPNLQQLTLSAADAKEDAASPNFADHEERLAEISCLTESLEQLRFLGFKPQRYQKELLIFLLTQVTNLKKMGLEFPKDQEAAVRRILKVRRAPAKKITTKYKNYLELEYPLEPNNA
ncbi:FBD-associated F-box protein At4g10400-like [Oryza brachyantha]|nr:FBD-associated F-box protein At4g10400-like [Oryza brachyantha]